jgi:hypothetical protein
LEDDLNLVVSQVNDYVSMTIDGRNLSEKCRDYVDGKQWTSEEIAKLKKRNQAPIVNNRVKVKHQGLLGLVVTRNTDPKAYPRNISDNDSADAVTDALRYVSDNNDFSSTKIDVADNFFCEGIGGVIVDVKANPRGEAEIIIDHISWDRLYYDPFSRRRDFKDSKYMGIMLWLDEEDVLALNPDIDISELIPEEQPDETFQDKPRWYIRSGNKKRFRVAQHFYLKDGVWYMCYVNAERFIIDPVESPYLDEYDVPTNPIELVGAYIDRENNRYGEIATFLDLQDEINHRRSKALFIMNRRQTMSKRGAIKDIPAVKRELAKPDGHVEYDGEKGDFDILQSQDMAQNQFMLLQEAKAEIDAQSFNAQLAGQRQSGDVSGAAISKLQQAAVIELANLYKALNNWELRVYRQVWFRIKQFWDAEKWIRVTDDYNSLRWVGFNIQVTAKEWLEEIINNDALDPFTKKPAAASYSFLMASSQNEDPNTAQAAQEQLEAPVDYKNNVPELDMDIIIDMSMDVINNQEEQFKLLVQFAQNGDVDIIDLIEISQLKNKKEIIEKIESNRAKRAEAQSQGTQAEQQALMIDANKAMSEAELNNAKAEQTKLETFVIMNKPIDNNPQIAV